jgi:hypothetical protein
VPLRAVAPDANIPGQINLFAMTANGQPTKAAAAIATSDYEYPKVDTLHCSWGTPMCYFATGIGGNGIQDYIYGVNRATGATVFKHTLPAGLYIDNLAFDYINEELWAVAFDPQAQTAALASWSPVTGNLTSRTDISASLRGGFVYGGAFSMCAPTRQIYVGIDSADGAFNDRAAQYDVSGAVPRLVGEIPLIFPVPSGFRAICNQTSFIALLANTVQADSDSRQTALIGQVVETQDQRAGLFIPLARGDLPGFNQNGQEALFLNGMFAEFGGQFIIPVYPPYQRGQRGPNGGFVWTISPFTPGPPQQGVLTPINYFLAGAAGVPTQ